MNGGNLSLALLVTICAGMAQAADQRDRRFDSDWRFLRADANGAEQPDFDDSAWRILDLPHDWSIEDLPSGEDVASASGGGADLAQDAKQDAAAGGPPSRVGPFDPKISAGGASTGHVVGGTGWYRKHFSLDPADRDKLVAMRFDGVYMNADVWLNGTHLGNHPYGYTSFQYDLTPYLKPAGEKNVVAVRVRNEGKNSRWYSGSGIYRHVWLTVTEPLHVPLWGVYITTPMVSPETATVKVATEVENSQNAETEVVVRTQLLDSDGAVLSSAESPLRLPPNSTQKVEQSLDVNKPRLWSPDAPNLDRAEVDVLANDEVIDHVSEPFGIRRIEVDAENGFRLNGNVVKLKGGCMHHDNGPLGAAAIDRAEERRVELMKANGFNAIRTSHNPPSPAFLDACDRLGMIVIDEAFDQWEKQKNSQDYHMYFDEWSDRDIASMIRRDRNHPSVGMWSIGNEIPERFEREDIAQRLRETVLAHDGTRPITAAICAHWSSKNRDWERVSEPAFARLDVGGYNYMPDKYEPDHARHTDRPMVCTESYPKELFDYWTMVEKHPYVIGDFVWTGMDYLGESGIGHTVLNGENDPFLRPWPWFNAYCGDIDICGFKKPQSYYRDVVWGRSQIEMAVHAPILAGGREKVSAWGWPDDRRSWTWPGQEGVPLQVAVYSRCEKVRLVLNGKPIGEQPVSGDSKLTARFDVPYEPGELCAQALADGKVVAEAVLRTSGRPAKIRLTADRPVIRAGPNDLSYVTVEVIDEHGQRVPTAEVPVRFTVTGSGELAAQGSGSPNDAASFRAPVRKTFEGRCIAILRPRGIGGPIELHAEADGLASDSVTVQTR
jgi:beta-galactosidase